MGTGAWTPFGGITVSKFFGMSHVPKLTLRYAHPLARQVDVAGDNREIQPGEELLLRASHLYLHDLRWSLGVFAEVVFTRALRENGTRVSESDARRVRFGGHLAWVFDYPNWELSLGAASDPLFDGVSKNVPYAGPVAALTLTRQFH
jgi:hypothetical protein